MKRRMENTKSTLFSLIRGTLNHKLEIVMMEWVVRRWIFKGEAEWMGSSKRAINRSNYTCSILLEELFRVEEKTTGRRLFVILRHVEQQSPPSI